MNANILIVDDSAVNAQFLKNVLEAEKHTVMVLHDGKDIIPSILSNNIDIVLLDIIMPGMNGYDILSLLRGTGATKDIPVIMVTSLTSPKEVKRALDSGALDFIRKSSEPIEVLARVNSALRLKRKQDMLKQIAQVDFLTQLYNKQYFNNTLNSFIKEKEKHTNGIALLLLDCDLFKNINDRFGHISGDYVLATVANAISGSVGSADVACRFGGEEFSVISPNTTASQAFLTAERIRTNIEATSFVLNGESVSVTVSCGVGHMGCDEEKSGLRLVNEADTALYRAKKLGRNQSVLFSNESTN